MSRNIIRLKRLQQCPRSRINDANLRIRRAGRLAVDLVLVCCDVVVVEGWVVCDLVSAANAVDCFDGLACCDVGDKGMADAVGENGILGAAEEELVAGAEDDTVTAAIGDGQDLHCGEVRGFDNIDLAAGVGVTFWDGDIDEAICGIPDWLLDAVCCIVERDFMDDLAVCDGDKGEYGDIVIGACDYCQLVVRIVSHLI